MKRRALLITALLFLAVSAVVLAQQVGPAKSPSRTVELNLIVTGSDKKSAPNIRKEDVQLIEDKVKQTVLSLELDKRPVDCGLVIDASASMNKHLNASLEAAKLIIDNRRTGDQFFIERFIDSETIENVQDFTTNRDDLVDALDSFLIGTGQSAVIDAVYLGANHLAERGAGNTRRKVLILLTDGEDRNSYYKYEVLIKQLQDKGVQVFAVGLTSELSLEEDFSHVSPKDRAEKLLRDLTSEAGGRTFFPKNKKDLLGAATQIVADLRSQFRLTYESTSDKKGFRKIDVKLTPASGEKLAAVLPRGYYFPN